MITGHRCDWCGAEYAGDRTVSIWPARFDPPSDLCADCYQLVLKLRDKIRQEALDREMAAVRDTFRQIESSNASEPNE